MVEEIYTRTSVRDFLEKDVSNELILKIIKLVYLNTNNINK